MIKLWELTAAEKRNTNCWTEHSTLLLYSAVNFDDENFDDDNFYQDDEDNDKDNDNDKTIKMMKRRNEKSVSLRWWQNTVKEPKPMNRQKAAATAAANYGASVVISCRQMNEWMSEWMKLSYSRSSSNSKRQENVSAVPCPRVSKNRVREWERQEQAAQNWTEQNTEPRTEQNTEPNTEDWKQTWLVLLYNQSKGNQEAIQAWREKNTSAKKILVVGRKRILREDNNNNNSDKDCFAINKKRQQTDNCNVWKIDW